MRNTRPRRLLTEERRRRVLEMVVHDGRATVDEIARRFAVSAVTARADLDALAARSAVVRSHGGAVKVLDPLQDYPLRFKESLHHAEKVRIGQQAAELIKPGQTILLDAGTTTEQIARQIKIRKLRLQAVITNALNIAVELAEVPDLIVVMIGGILRPSARSFVGPQAERMLQDVHADNAFLATDGIDVQAGLSTPDILEAQIKALMVRISDEVTVVADASKFGRRSLSTICGIGSIRRVVTDSRVSQETAQAFRDLGVDVLIG